MVEGLESARLKGKIDLLYPKVVKGLIGLPSAQPEQGWIPCEKELPEEYGEYRITWITSASKKRFNSFICRISADFML